MNYIHVILLYISGKYLSYDIPIQIYTIFIEHIIQTNKIYNLNNIIHTFDAE